MKTIFTLLIALLLSIGVLGQSAADAAKAAVDKVKDAARDAAATTEEEPTTTVRGRVFYEDTGQPLRRSWIGFVRIKKLNPDPNEMASPITGLWDYQNVESVLTNDFGEFVMKDVAPGIYQAVLKVPGILNPTMADRESPVFQQFMIDGVSEAQIEVGVRRGGAVSGRVMYQDGAPLIGAKVSLLPVFPPIDPSAEETDKEKTAQFKVIMAISGIGTAQTDDRGYYRFAGVPEGEYRVMVAEPSVFDGSNTKVSAYSTQRYFNTSELKTFYPNAKSEQNASSLQVLLGEELQDIDITLAPRELYELVGRVVGRDNNALVDGIEVRFERVGKKEDFDYQSKQIRTTTTDKEGVWRFKDMLPGKYFATVAESSYRRYDDPDADPQARPNYATSEHRFEILEGERNEVILRIAEEAKLEGTITVEGNRELPDSVWVYADSRTDRASSDTPETTDYESEETVQMVQTEFSVDDLKEGEYFISVRASDEHYAKSITYQGKNVMDQPIKVKAGQKLEGFRVVLSSGSGKVTGKVVDAKQTDYIYAYMMPVRADISLYRAYLLGDSDYIGDDFTFELSDRPGEYYLFVKDGMNEPKTRDATPESLDNWVRKLLKNAVKIRIQRGRTVEAELSMPKKDSEPETP